MKKRKPPVVLATCLVLLLVTVGIMYKPGQAATDPHAQEQQAPPPPSTEQGTRPKMSPSDVSSMAVGQMAPSGTPGGMPRAPMAMGGPSKGASIAVPKQQVYKPQPNESSTSTQWYTDQTRK